MWRAIPILLALLALARPAAAQIVNVQSLIAAPGNDGLSGQIEGSLDWHSGNTDSLDLAGSGVPRYKWDTHLAVAIYRGEVGYALGVRIIGKTFEHLREIEKWNDWFSTEVFIQHEIDQFRRLALRALIGAGPRFQIIDEKEGALAMGVSYFVEHEELATVGQPDDGQTDTTQRLSFYVTGRVLVEKNLEVVATVYAQPRPEAPGDIRILQETALVVKINDRFSLKTEFTLGYDSEPPIAVKTYDTELKSAFTLKL